MTTSDEKFQELIKSIEDSYFIGDFENLINDSIEEHRHEISDKYFTQSSSIKVSKSK